MSQSQIIILDSLTEDIFVCGSCKQIFNSMHLFLDHKRQNCYKEEGNLHLNQPNLFTNTQMNNTDTFYPGMDEEEPVACTTELEKVTALRNDTSCLICKKHFKKPRLLRAHLKSHERPFQCLVCGRCFENNSHTKRHVMSHRVWPDGLSETTPKSTDAELLSYSCSYCDLVLANYSQFRHHVNSHLHLKKFKCIQGDCNTFFDTLEDLLHHVSVSHEYPIYTCHVCKKTFNELEDMAIHHKNHNLAGEKPEKKIQQFKCSQCDATFRRHETLSLHLLTENHNKACVHCEKSFASSKRLRMHLQTHQKVKPHYCNICNRSFHLKKYLNSHMLKHGEKHFTCTICDQKFKRQDILQRHRKTHLLRNMFKCPFRDIDNCIKEFSRKDKLADHMKTHTI